MAKARSILFQRVGTEVGVAVMVECQQEE